MRLRLIREPSIEGATLGCLFVEGHFACFTLEDEIRDVKIPGETAIPAGAYVVGLTHSQRFQRVLPEVFDVPGFAGVRMHSGNAIGDTHGCILVGKDRQGPRLLQSRAALESLLARLGAATDPLAITIENPAV